MDIHVQMVFKRADGTFLYQHVFLAGEPITVDFTAFHAEIVDDENAILGFEYKPKVRRLSAGERRMLKKLSHV